MAPDEGERARGVPFLERHGITWTVALRLAVVVLLLVVVGVRFERTMIALAISAVFLVVFVILGHNDEV